MMARRRLTFDTPDQIKDDGAGATFTVNLPLNGPLATSERAVVFGVD